MKKFTKSVKSNEVKREWIVLDAENQTFGRLITQAATFLRGKHKPYFTPHVDCGDYVIIINASKVKFNGNNKMTNKQYHRHSGYFGSVKSETLEKLLEKSPEKLFKLATRGMLPKTKLGKKMLSKLKVYRDDKLSSSTKEMLGLVASLVLRCDDCIKYHLVQCFEEGISIEEIEEVLSVGLIVGGSITIPHIRKAFEFWENLIQNK